jgi:hypothetical protein
MNHLFPEAKRAKTSADTSNSNNNNAASDYNATATRNTKSTSNLLIRLSQGCLCHAQTCHSRDNEEEEEEEEENNESMVPKEQRRQQQEQNQQCASEMKKLARLIPLIEASCQNAIAISPSEIQNLALFYISVVQRIYCPYSLLYIFNNGKGGIEGEHEYY